MPGEYRHIKQYEKEIFKLREEGYTHRQTGKQFGFEQIKINVLTELNYKHLKMLEKSLTNTYISIITKDFN